MTKPKKSSIAIETVFLFISIFVNMLALPVAFFIAIMAADASDSMTEMIMAFLFVQGIPLLLLAVSLFLFLSRIRQNRKNEEAQKEE
ncbi:hypothetical protein [Ureibacillus sinduriensis]|uniref:hypothetical protein n=1 Tax=Ureibacillus sinduriensis TaxID=561440 RepID=UPI000A92C97B|nr:hypothetical protein [Ureibacillus sinduriensis]